MRKWVVAINDCAALFMSVITTSQASFDGIKLADYPKNSVLYQSINTETSLQHLNQMIVYQITFLMKKKQPLLLIELVLYQIPFKKHK